MYVCSGWSSGIQGTFRMCVCTCTCTQTGPVRHSEDIQNVCMYMYVYSDWSSETSRGSSVRVYVLVRVLRLVQWDIQNVCMSMYVFSGWSSGTFRTCVCTCICNQIGPVRHPGEVQNVCMSIRPCTCSQTGPVGHSERVYVPARVLRLVQRDI